MLPIFRSSFALATLLALVPATVSWLSGRRLVRRLDDPVLPERFMAHQRRNTAVLGIAFLASTTIEPRASAWIVPLLFSGTIAAAYPLRRAMFGETWSFGAYLSFFHRLSVGLFGLWAVLAATPALAAMAGSLDWLAGAIAAGLLLAWNRYYSQVLAFLLRCQPLDDGPLLRRCRDLAAKCAQPPPLFLRVDLGGGALANAVALPSVHGNGVLFTSTLLERMTEDEIVAVCGHELAHLEYHTPARLARLNRATVTIIVLGGVLTPALRLSGISSPWMLMGWLGTLAALLVVRAKDKQRQETICDARAVELTGDPEPLVSALTKLYALARLPRRIAMQQDRAASHPSLSRRIRDIRRAAGKQPAGLCEPATFYSGDGSSVITFEAASLHWEQDAGVTQVIAYSHLHELRLDAERRGSPRLCAVSDRGRTWQMPVSTSDVPRLQAVLDSIDGRLGDVPAPRGLPVAFSRLLVTTLSLLAFAAGQMTVAGVVLLAALRPAPALLGGAAAGAFGAALLVLRDRPLRGGAAAVLVLLVATGVLAMLRAMNRHQETRSPRAIIAALATLAALVLVSTVLGGVDPIRLHQGMRTAPALPVLLVSIAAALASMPHARTRITAAAVTAVAALIVTVSSQAFLDTFGKDPFLLDTPELAVDTIETAPGDRFPIPESTTRVQLSPDGQFISAQQDAEGEDDHSPVFHLGRLGDPLTAMSADAVRFLDDDTVLVMDADQDGTSLRQISLTSSHDVLWRQRVPRLQGAALSLSRDGRWHLQGWEGDETIVRAEGFVGAAELQQRHWPAGYARDAWINAMTTAGPEPLVVETHYDRGLLRHLPARAWMLASMLHGLTEGSRYWLAGEKAAKPLGESRFGVSCSTGTSDGALLCSVDEGTHTRLVRLAAADGAVSAIGRVDGRFVPVDATADGWLTGWLGSSAVAIDLVNRRLLRLAADEGVAGALSISGGRLALIVRDGDGSSLRVCRIPAGEGKSFRLASGH